MPNRSDPEKRVTIYSSAAAAVCVCACGAVCCALILLSGLVSYMLAGAACALFGAALFLAVRYFLKRLIRDFRMPLAHLRDSAVRIAGGELDVRADENEVPYSEIGEVGKAVNELSDRLSMNIYHYILERNRLQSILYNLSEGIIAIDTDGNITHTNPALEKLLNCDSRINGEALAAIDSGLIYADLKNALESGQNIERDFVISGRNIHSVISPLMDEISVTAGAIGLFADITEQERLEATRREYVANVSHEMRTPLTAVRALVEPLREGMVRDEETRMRYYDIILREVMRLTRLISDLMELSRLQSGTLALEKSEIELGDLLYDVCGIYSERAADHELTFEIKSDFNELPKVYSNADRVEQLMVILLDNAIKYTEKGGLTVESWHDDEKVYISVSDTGIGIDEKDLPYVFDRFYKVDKAHSGKGSGLGLSIAKELWDRMGESLTVKSEKGVGTTFTFTVGRAKREN